MVTVSPPYVRIGTADGPEHTLFAGLLGAVLGPSNEIIAADAGNNRIVYLDQLGNLLATVGRTGSGPGEFRLPRWFGVCSSGDLAIMDAATDRLTFFNTAGKLVGSVQTPSGVGFDQMVWCSGADRWFMLLNMNSVEPRRGERSEVRTALVRIRGGTMDTIARRGSQIYYFSRRIPAFSPVPLGAATLASAGKDRLFYCTNGDGACQVFDTLGTVMATFTLRLRRLRVSRKDWQAAVQDQIDREPLLRVRKRMATVLEELPAERSFPLIDRIQADARGRLWVRTFDNYRSPMAAWVIVDTEGRATALVATPRDLNLFQVGDDHLLGFTRDRDGVERIVMYRVHRLP